MKKHGKQGHKDRNRRGGPPPRKPRHHAGHSERNPGYMPARAGLYGFHAVRAAWLNPVREIEALFVTEQGQQSFEQTLAEAKRNGLRRPQPLIVDKHQIEKMLPRDAVHQGLALVAGDLPETGVQDMIIAAQDKNNILLMLDQVTDPHNVGAILRSASAFGVAGVIMQRRHAPELNNGVLAKTACGAIEYLPVAYETNLSRAIEQLKEGGFFVLGLDERGAQTIGEYAHGAKPGNLVLVLGAEGEGLRRLVAENCDALLRLPTQGAMQSLNVSNAAAVALYALAESQSQRR